MAEKKTTKKTATKKKTKKEEKSTAEKKNIPGRFVKGNEIGKETRFQYGNDLSEKYKEEYADELIKFFSDGYVQEEYEDGKGIKRVLVKRVPTMRQFCNKINISSTETLSEWAKRHARFRFAYARALEIEKDLIKTGALSGDYDANIAKFVLSCDFGMKETQKIETENKTEVTAAVDDKTMKMIDRVSKRLNGEHTDDD